MVYDRTKKPEKTLKDIDPIEHGPNPFIEYWKSKPRTEHPISPFSAFETIEKAPEKLSNAKIKKR